MKSVTRLRAARMLSALLAVVVAFFLVGGVSAAQTAGAGGDSGVGLIDLSIDGSDGAGDVGASDVDAEFTKVDTDTSEPDVGVDVGAEASDDETTSIIVEDGVIDLIPAVSKEISPEEAIEAGQGDRTEDAATAGVGENNSTVWIVLGALVLIGGALVIARVGKGAAR